MAVDHASGCRCKRCDSNQPHHPVDETLILRALKNDPPIYGPTKRRLAFYDSRRVPVSRKRHGHARQPWQPIRRAA